MRIFEDGIAEWLCVFSGPALHTFQQVHPSHINVFMQPGCNYSINSHKHYIHIHDEPCQSPAGESSY